MENHITTEVTHYKGKIYAWDVVNEPFDDNNPSMPRQDVFFNAFGGTGYIADALKTAHAADPNAKLYINDYNIELPGSKQDAMFNLASSLKSAGVPLDGIGFESHFVLGQVTSASVLETSMARFTALGLNVAITELDDRIQLPASSANLAQQANEFGFVVTACLKTSGCPGVTQWAVGDADSWVPGAFSGQGAATMFDSNYQPKPAFNTVLSILNGGGGGTNPPPTTTMNPPPTTTGGGGGGSCTATYATTGTWNTGFQAQVTVKAGSSAISSWTVTWTLASGQTITQLWNGALTTSGSNITVKNLSYNGSLAAGASTTFGYTANGTANSPTLKCTSP
jgi:endo-1,4-beta-xylanase